MAAAIEIPSLPVAQVRAMALVSNPTPSFDELSEVVDADPALTAALLRDGPIDRIVWFRAPMMLGGDGVPAAESFGLQTLNAAPRFNREGAAPAGEDMVETYKAR